MHESSDDGNLSIADKVKDLGTKNSGSKNAMINRYIDEAFNLNDNEYVAISMNSTKISAMAKQLNVQQENSTSDIKLKLNTQMVGKEEIRANKEKLMKRFRAKESKLNKTLNSFLIN